jgi:hypothetical protein
MDEVFRREQRCQALTRITAVVRLAQMNARVAHLRVLEFDSRNDERVVADIRTQDLPGGRTAEHKGSRIRLLHASEVLSMLKHGSATEHEYKIGGILQRA